jgi:hypothetical protein
VADSVGAIMHRDPDLDALPAETPAAIRRLLRRCLARKRTQRLHDIADARLELEEAIEHPELDAPPAEAPQQQAARSSKLPWIALAILAPLLAVLGWWIGSAVDPAAPEPVRRFTLAHGVEVDAAAISPDGSRVAYRVGGELRIRSLQALDARTIATDLVDGPLAWSPDGRSLVLLQPPNNVLRVDLDGGAPLTLSESVELAEHVHWADDGHIYFAQFQAGISRIPATGGAVEPVLGREDLIDYHGLAVLPGGRGFLTLPHLTGAEEATEIVVERPGREPHTILSGGFAMTRVIYSPSGHLLYHRDVDPRGLWAVGFSLDDLRATGEPMLLVPDLDDASVSSAGDLVYARSGLHQGDQEQRLVLVDRQGTETYRLELPLYQAIGGKFSPDGSRFALNAVGVGRPSTGRQGIWTIDLDRRTGTRVTVDRIQSMPNWSEDGTRIAYAATSSEKNGHNIFTVRADGSGDRQLLMTADMQFFLTLNSDWSIAAFMRGSMQSEWGMSIAYQRLGDDTFTTLVDGPDHEAGPTIHPDGEWIAYMAGSLPSLDAVIRPFPDGEGQWIVSRDGVGSVFWALDGKSLYYTTSLPRGQEGKLYEVAFDGSTSPATIGQPKELFAFTKGTPLPAPNGQFAYFETLEPAEGEDAPDRSGIVLVQNWASRLDDVP